MQYRLIASIGAVSLLAASHTSAAPLLPQNGWLVWESNREDSRQEVYIKKVGVAGENRLTFLGGRLPLWSPDGEWISYFDMDNGWTTIMRPDGSDKKKICDSQVFDWKAGGQFWMHDKTGLICEEAGIYYRYDTSTAKRSQLVKIGDYVPTDEYVPSNVSFEVRDISHDGAWMGVTTGLFRDGYGVKNGEFKAVWAAALVNIANKELFFLGGGCEPTFSPKRAMVFHVCNNEGCANPTDIAQMDLADRMTRSSYAAVVSYPDAQWGHDYYPRISNDDLWLVYSGALEHAGNYDVFIHKLGENDQQRERVVNSTTTKDTFPDLYIGKPHGLECAGDTDCDDANACTTDSCKADFKCKHDPIADCCTKPSDCDDSNPCTSNLCSSNKCTFDVISGCCTKAEDCDDVNDCTANVCTDNVCVFNPIAGCCDGDDDCQTSNPCNDGSCDTSTGTCSFTSVEGCCAFDTDCDDQKSCTQDKCSSQTCEYLPIEACCEVDSDCDDGDPCTSDQCSNNGCELVPSDCGASDAGPDAGAISDHGFDQGTAAGAGVSGPRLSGGCSLPRTPPSAPWPLLPIILLFTRRRFRRRRKPHWSR